MAVEFTTIRGIQITSIYVHVFQIMLVVTEYTYRIQARQLNDLISLPPLPLNRYRINE